MSRWKPTRERLPGLHESDEGSGCGPKGRCTELREEVGPVGVRKVLLAEKAVTGQKLGFSPRGLDLTPCIPCFYSQASIQVS